MGGCDTLPRAQPSANQSRSPPGVNGRSKRTTAVFPHGTIARLNRPDPAQSDAYVEAHEGFGISPIHMDSFVLHSSFLSKSATAKLLITGQAPGTRVQEASIPGTTAATMCCAPGWPWTGMYFTTRTAL